MSSTTRSRRKRKKAPAAVPTADAVSDLILARVRLRSARRVAWLRTLWETEANGNSPDVIGHSEVDTHLAQLDRPEAEASWVESEPQLDRINKDLARVERRLQDNNGSRYATLKRLLQLDQIESDILQTCYASAIDPSFGRIFGYLQDHGGRTYPTESLVARIFNHGLSLKWSPESGLRTWRLITETATGVGEPNALELDPSIRDWLLGHDDLDRSLVGVTTLLTIEKPLDTWPIEATCERVRTILEASGGGPLRITIGGPRGGGRRTFAATVAARLDFPLLLVDTDSVDPATWTDTFIAAQRHAFLSGCALAWIGNRAQEEQWPSVSALFPLQFTIAESIEHPVAIPGVIDETIALPWPSLKERRRLWRRFVPQCRNWPRSNFEDLVGRRRVTVGDIRAVGMRKPTDPKDAVATLSHVVRRRMGSMAQRLECPFRRDDLIVPDHVGDLLNDFLIEARARRSYWERPEARRLFPSGPGLVAVLSGPSGTGKTMTAQVIASELDLDLYRVNLALLVSKYVGETSKNAQRILRRASEVDAVLFFDEADALFGRRTQIRDAHDRFANTDTDYLLQEIETYPGIAILATNRKGDLDPAFTRRMRFLVDFPRPDMRLRLVLWQRLVEELWSPKQSMVLMDFLTALATQVEVTGAQIKHSVLSAVFTARNRKVELGPAELIRGLERELIKEGAALSNRDRQTLMSHAP